MSHPGQQDAPLAALRRLLQDRQPSRAAVPRIEPIDAYAAQHLAEIDPARFTRLIEFLNGAQDDTAPGSASADHLAQRLLLDEYGNAIRRLRTIASATDLVLAGAEATIRDGQRLIRTYAPREASTRSEVT